MGKNALADRLGFTAENESDLSTQKESLDEVLAKGPDSITAISGVVGVQTRTKAAFLDLLFPGQGKKIAYNMYILDLISNIKARFGLYTPEEIGKSELE